MVEKKYFTSSATVASLVSLFLLCVFSLPVHSRMLYLSTEGDDNVACAPGAVFRTLSRAVECLAPRDTLLVREGIYGGGVIIGVQGSAATPVLIQGESLEAVISGSGERIDAIRIQNASHVTIDRLTVSQAKRAGASVRHSNHIRITDSRFADNGKWGIFTSFADDIHFEGNECYGSIEEHGIYHSNSGDRFIVRNNLVHDNSGNGIHLNGDPEIPGGDGILNFGLVEGNVIYGNGKSGGGAINMTHVHDIIVRNNLIYKNLAGGITIYQDTGTFEQGSKRVLVTGNTVFYETARGRSGVNVQTTSEKILIAGNIFVSGGKRGTLEVNSDHLGSIVTGHNILWGVDEATTIERKDTRISLARWRAMAGNDMHTLAADPEFIDPDAGNFKLSPSSAALDAGMPLDSVKVHLKRLGGFEWILAQLDTLPHVDILGHRRPAGEAPDAGAYESGAH